MHNKTLSTKSQREEYLRLVVTALLFLFPIAAIAVKHGSTFVFYFLAAVGLSSGWSGWKVLPLKTKRFLCSLGFLFLSMLLSLALSDNFSRGLSKLEKYLRLPLVIPVFLLLVKIDSKQIERSFLVGCLLASVAGFGYSASQSLVPVVLFTVPAGFNTGLANSDLTRDFRQEFLRHGYPLAHQKVSISVDGGEWILRDANQRWARVVKNKDLLQIRGPRIVRAKGPYHPIVLGILSIHLACIIFAWLLTSTHTWKQRGLGISCLGCALYCSLLTGTRGAWLCIPVVLTITFGIYLKRLRTKALVAILFGIGIVLVATKLLLPQSVESRIEVFQNSLIQPTHDLSANERLEMWRASLIIFSESPVLGSGIGDFRDDLKRLIDDGKSPLQSAHDHAHNIYFDSLARTGIVGTGIMLVVLFLQPYILFYRAWGSADNPATEFNSLAGMLTIISFMVFGLTEAWFSRMALFTVYVVSLMVFLSGTGTQQCLNAHEVATTNKEPE